MGASGIAPACRLACLDLAGTTMRDDGLVEGAFAAAAQQVGADAEEALAYARQRMGQSKIDVFRGLLGDERRALAANEAFERCCAEAVGRGDVAEIPGAGATMARMRAAGIRVCLLTGFAPATRDLFVAALGWGGLVDLALSPQDAGRGRPYPDMILTAARRLGVDDMRAVAVTGDTASDVRAGVSAGAGVVAGVLSGSHSRAELCAAGATHVVEDVNHLPAILAVP